MVEQNNQLRSVGDCRCDEFSAELRKLIHSVSGISASQTPEELSKTLLSELVRNLGAGSGSVYRVLSDSLELIYALDTSHLPQRIHKPLRSQSPFLRAIETREMVFTADISSTKELSSSGWTGYKNTSFVVYPLLDSQNNVFALTALHDNEKGHFSEQQCELGQILASFGAQSLCVLESTELIRESEQKLTRLMSNLPGMAYQRTADSSCTVLFASDGCTSLTGYPPEAIIGDKGISFLELIHQDDRNTVKDEVKQAVAQNRGFRISYRVITANAETKWVWELGTPVLSRDGKSVHVEGFITDISDYKRAEDERNQLAMAIEQSVESVVICDALGTIQYVNPAFEIHTGYSREEALGNDMRFLYANQHDEAFFDKQWETISQGDVWTGTISNLQKDGTPFNEEVSISSVRDISGSIVYFVITSRDITKELQLETHLRQAQKMEAIGELAAGVAHEINTPTQYIGDNIRFFQETFTDLSKLVEVYAKLSEKAESEGLLSEETKAVGDLVNEIDLEYLLEEVPTAIEQSLEGNRRVAEIVRAMKEFAHPGNDEATGIDINRAISSTISVARNEWRYVADVETALDDKLTLIPGHTSAFNQVILNLIVNAAHAIGDALGENPSQKGTIRITTEAQGKWAIIRVQDTGTGIPEEIKCRIFDPFFTTKRAGKGTGYGLAVAHSVIIEQHKGQIEVDSTPGKGTTFILRLPMHSTDES